MNKPTEEKGVFTILSKTGCKNCNLIKRVMELTKLSYIYVDCDEYILNNREQFIEELKKYTKSEERVYFPIVFYEGKYLEEPFIFIDTLLDSF